MIRQTGQLIGQPVTHDPQRPTTTASIAAGDAHFRKPRGARKNAVRIRRRRPLLPHSGLGLAAGPGLLPGLLEPLKGKPGPALAARLASLYHRRLASDRARLVYRSCRISRACFSMMCPRLRKMLPRLEPRLQRPLATSHQPTGDGSKVGFRLLACAGQRVNEAGQLR
jgi:hypothetical protein